MVNFRNLTDKAKDVVEKRGGSESLKRDADQLKSIAKGPGTLSEKAKAAASALKDPGGTTKTDGAATAGTAETPTSSTAPKAGGETVADSTRVDEPPRAAADTAAGAGETPREKAGKAKVSAARKTGKKTDHDKAPGEVGGSK